MSTSPPRTVMPVVVVEEIVVVVLVYVLHVPKVSTNI